MSKGYALLIGLGQVDPKFFPSTLSKGAEANEYNVKRMRDLLRQVGFVCRVLLTKDATKAAIVRALGDHAEALSPGDIFVFYFAGHRFGLEDNVKTDSIAVYDGMLAPSDLRRIWGGIAAGVRIFSISDACSSEKTYELPAGLEAELQEAPLKEADEEDLESRSLSAQMIHFGAARQGYSAPGGFLTTALLSVWSSGFEGTYRSFFSATLSEYIKEFPDGIAQYKTHGPVTTAFENQQPFTIEAPPASQSDVVASPGIRILFQRLTGPQL